MMEKTPAVFTKGKEYRLKYSQTHPSKRWRGTSIPSEYIKIEYIGLYEYIGSRGSKMHFYDNSAGIDVLMSMTEALLALENGAI